MQFFTRIEYMTLQPGNKSAGFFLSVAVQAARVLAELSVAAAEHQHLLNEARARVKRSGLIPTQRVDDVGFSFFAGGVPKVFWVDATIGGSLGAQPEELRELLDHARVEGLGLELTYSPHNVDVPAQALVLMILQQTWAEWAYDKLLLAEAQTPLKETIHENSLAK